MIFNQVNRILNKRYVINHFLRNVHIETSAKVLYPLRSRALLKIRGQDASTFLQGLITNDMKHFEEGAKSVYAMFLNNKGRVMYDTLIHKWNNDETFLIECDKKLVNPLQKHLKIYKLKRKVEIEVVDKDYVTWALIQPEIDLIPELTSNVNIYKDPRLVDLGFRIISSSDTKCSQIAEMIGKDLVTKDSEEGYKYLRYKLGVSEGAEDLPPGTSFPLEANCDYLHGVSFHKGCYIGQELTARVHHTGVVRKRIMPIKFNQSISENIEKDSVISAGNNPKSNLGKLKGVIDNYGIGLIRIKEALDAKVLTVSKYSAEVLKPAWWPLEAPKEIQKNDTMDDSKPKDECTQVVCNFKCSQCGMNEEAHYKGVSPPFSRKIQLKHPSYVMKDPFSPPGKGEILILGADCAICDKTVCISKQCSIFYLKTYCLECVQNSDDKFPTEVTNKVKKN